MSLSVSVRPSVRSHFVWFGAFKAFEARCFEGVARVSQGCLFEVSRVFGSFKEVLRVFQGSLKGVSRKFQVWFKEVSMKFQGSFKKVSMIIK